MNEKAERKVLFGKDKCHSCCRRVVNVNTPTDSDMPAKKCHRTEPEQPLTITNAMWIDPYNARKELIAMEAACAEVVDRAAATVLSQCIAGYTRVSAELMHVQQAVHEQGGVVAGLTEIAGAAIREQGDNKWTTC